MRLLFYILISTVALSVSAQPLQNFVENNASNDTVLDSTKDNTASTTPRPPKMSDKKCPIHRAKIGY